MKLLVTGGCGFIGSNFVRYWLSNYDDRIVNLDKLTYAGNPANLKDFESDPRYSFVKGDICDVNLVDKLVKDCDVVVHFAAESHVDRSIDSPAVFVLTNVVGTQIILDAVIKYDKRIHHVSTDEVYGDLELDSKDKFTPDTKYSPSSPYSASKAGADHLVRAYGRTFGLKHTISNCSNNYGPYQHVEKLIPTAVTNLLEGKKVPVYGDGLNVRDWLYVEDHASAIDKILKEGKIGETYLVGSDGEKNNISLIKLILKEMDFTESQIEYVSDRKGHDRRYAVDSSKLRNELGWKASVTFEDGLKKTIDWYKNNTDWWKPLKV